MASKTMIVCMCNFIKDKDIDKAKEENVKTIEELSDFYDFEWCCCRCLPEVEERLK